MLRVYKNNNMHGSFRVWGGGVCVHTRACLETAVYSEMMRTLGLLIHSHIHSANPAERVTRGPHCSGHGGCRGGQKRHHLCSGGARVGGGTNCKHMNQSDEGSSPAHHLAAM